MRVLDPLGGKVGHEGVKVVARNTGDFNSRDLCGVPY
jgi:hypothetical protein